MSEIERTIQDLAAENRISLEDADAVREFAVFLEDMHYATDKATVLLDHADFLGLSEGEREKLRGVNPSHGHRTGTYNPEER